MLPLSHPKSSFHVSGNHQMVNHPGAPGNLGPSLPAVTWCLSCPVLRGHLSLSDTTVGMVGHFCAVSHTERSLGQKGRLSVSRRLSVPPFYGR